MSVSGFTRFTTAFRLTGSTAGDIWRDKHLAAADGYLALAGAYAGSTFDQGLYRLHDAESGPAAQTWIGGMFPDYADRARPFGYDWLGRQFALDSNRLEAGQSLVLMIEPGTGEVLEIPATLRSFHEDELVEYGDAALATSFFAAWRATPGAVLPLAADSCVGYRVPLFVGGKDTVDNLEVSDLDVYWSFCSQVFQGTRGLPEGTAIRGVTGATDGDKA